MNILIVDDEKMEIEIIQKLIDRNRFAYSAIYTAQSVKKAKKICNMYPISIIICDIEMPQENGHDLVRWIRNNQMEIEVIYLTGHAEFSYATTALRLGAVDYLLKPVDQEDLMKALEKASHKIPQMQLEQGESLSAEKIVEKVKEYIQNNCEKDISRIKIAERFFIHPDYLSHIFKEWTGETFQDYIIHARIEKGKKLLTQTDMSISNIATNSGYSNTAYFAKHFKRETGMSPKEYRKSARQKK